MELYERGRKGKGKEGKGRERKGRRRGGEERLTARTPICSVSDSSRKGLFGCRRTRTERLGGMD